MKQKKTMKLKAWLALPHHTQSHGRGINGQQIYIQKTKPTIVLDCECKALVVPCTITYEI